MSAESVALDHYADRQRLSAAMVAVARRAWERVAPGNIRASWLAQVPALTLLVSGAQMAAAQQADPYLTDVLAEQGIAAAAAGAVEPRQYAGTASDGRALDTLLEQPSIAALVARSRGYTVDRALASGWASLDMIVRTQVADAGRAADQTALTSRRAAGGYVRMVVGKTCSRCVILAGRWYEWNAGFDRHPRCDCVHLPSSEDRSGDLRTDPKAYFRSLTRDEQDQTFGKAGAEAIREGADMAQIVNARRGMYTADGQLLTTESTSRRGIAPAHRPMPEQIFREANGDRDEALRLLRLHRYLI